MRVPTAVGRPLYEHDWRAVEPKWDPILVTARRIRNGDQAIKSDANDPWGEKMIAISDLV